MIDIKPLKLSSKQKTLNPVDETIKDRIDQFLSSDFYMKEFNQLTRGKKFKSKEAHRMYLLTIQDGEIGFKYPELNTLFARWQLYNELKDKPGYDKILNGSIEEAKKFLNLVQP